MSRLLAIPWYGGKFNKLSFILPNIPRDAKHFVDVYGGSGSVLLNLSRFPHETYNDLNVDLVTFFRTLKYDFDEFFNVVFLTPHSRYEYEASCDRQNDNLDNIERARLFFVRTKQAYMSIESAGRGCWGYAVAKRGGAYPPKNSINHIYRLIGVHERLTDTNIENLPAIDLIKKYDSKDTLFYVDPPYVHSSRKGKVGYSLEMSNDDHKELGYVLNNIKGRAVLSGYKNDLYDNDLFKHWRRVDDKVRIIRTAMRNKDRSQIYRQESLWINFA